MTRFRFRLDRLLRLREGLEKQRATELGQALDDQARRSAELAAAEGRLANVGGDAGTGPAPPAAAGSLIARSYALRFAADQVNEAAERERSAERRSETERGRFREARQDRESLARLREKRRGDWKTETARNEQKDSDETARRRHSGGEAR